MPAAEAESARYRIDLVDDQLGFFENRSPLIRLPNTPANLRFLCRYLAGEVEAEEARDSHWEDDLVTSLAAKAAPLFAAPATTLTQYLERLSSTISLKNALESLLILPAFKDYESSVILIHRKGESQALLVSSGAGVDDRVVPANLDHFNDLFRSVKKSKRRQFSCQQERWRWLPLSGVFIAEALALSHFNVIWIISRQEFLPATNDELTTFAHLSRLTAIWLESLIEAELGDLNLGELLWALDNLPFGLALTDPQGKAIYSNQRHQSSEPPVECSRYPLSRGYELQVEKVRPNSENPMDAIHSQKISLLGDLFNTLRHELSNPLFGLGLACDLLITQDLPEDVGVMLGEVRKNIQRSQQIIHNLSKLYSEDTVTNECSLLQVVTEALTLAKSELKTIRKYVAAIPPELRVHGRPLLVVQVLFNLLVNSAQAMRSTPSPEIHIGLRPHSDHLELEIRDTGPGLPASVQSNLFKPFTTTKQKGHGLGLALSRDLALKLGGELRWVPTESGACFILKLRRAP